MSEVSTERRPLRSGPLVGGVDAAWDRLLRPPAKRTVVMSPHPDDEALSSGGLIMHQLARGVPVVVVTVTDGEAAYPTWSDPDHTACARAGEHLVRTRSCTLFGSLFWAFHRVDPTDHPSVRIAGLHLSEDDSMWRWEAIQSHASQFDAGDQAPILDRPLVERLCQPIEYYVVKP